MSGIQVPPAVTRSVRRNRQTIDYLTLNDGLEDDEVSSPKRKKRTTYRPGSGPSATCQAARKHTGSPEPKSVPRSRIASPLPAIPALTSKNRAVPDTALTGVPNVMDEQKLPDLVLEHKHPDTSQAMGAISTEEEMDAAAALLSLGEVQDDTLDGDYNAELMPIGGQNVAVDAAPEPIRLDQVSVDKAIAGLIQDDQNRDTTTNDKQYWETENPPAPSKPNDPNGQKPRQSTEKNDEPESTAKGTLKTKTYALKTKVETKK